MEHVETVSDYRGSAVRGCHWSVAGASPSGPDWPAQSSNVRLSETVFEKVPSWSRPDWAGPGQAKPTRAKAEEDRPLSVFSSWPLQPWGLAACASTVRGGSHRLRGPAEIIVKVTASFINMLGFFLKTHCFDGKDMISSNTPCCSGSTGPESPENHFPPRRAGLCWSFSVLSSERKFLLPPPPPSTLSTFTPTPCVFFENVALFLQ